MNGILGLHIECLVVFGDIRAGKVIGIRFITFLPCFFESDKHGMNTHVQHPHFKDYFTLFVRISRPGFHTLISFKDTNAAPNGIIQPQLHHFLK